MEAVRDGNSIKISVKDGATSGLENFAVFVDEEMVDMDQEVVVTVDGKERFRGPAPTASLVTLLESAQEREDPEYTFARLLRLSGGDDR